MLTVIDIVAKASLILAGATLAAASMRRASAAARHFIWTLGLAGALSAPLLSAVLPRVEVPLVRVTADAPLVAPAPLTTTTKAPPLRRRAPFVSTATTVAPTPVVRVPRNLPSIGALAVLAWGLGAGLILGRLLIGLAAVHVMSRRVPRVSDAPWLRQADELAATLGLSRVRFLQSPVASMPMAWGIFRPSVVMPSAAESWPAETLRIVLLHELAHVKRRDCLTHLVAQAACALYWFDPLVWVAVRRLRAERERACDDLVLAAGTRGSDYADRLLDIARLMNATRFPGLLAGASLAMAHRSQLEGRLMAILDPSVPRRGMTRGRALLVSLACACAIVPIASVQPWADERPVTVGHDALLPAQPTARAATAPAQTPARASQPAPSAAPVEGTPGGVVGGVVGGIVDGIVDGVVEGITKGVTAGVGSRAASGIGQEIALGLAEGISEAVSRAAQAKPAIAGEKLDGCTVDPRTVNALIEALKDTDKDVREAALHALAQVRDPRVFDPLVLALKDSSAGIREQAAFGLGQLRDARAIEPLTGALHDECADVREQAAFALGQIRDPRAVEALVIALKDGVPGVREQAAFALGQIRDPRSIDGLTAALKDEKASVRRQAAFALGQIR